MVLLDGTTHVLPEARVTLSSPYFMGETLAKCMESPIYDVVLGNITCELGDPDSTWKFPEVKVPRVYIKYSFQNHLTGRRRTFSPLLKARRVRICQGLALRRVA